MTRITYAYSDTAPIYGEHRAYADLTDDAVGTGGAGGVEAWKVANRQYFNVKQVGDATRATPGELSPAQLLTQVNKAQPSARFGAGNDLAELAQWAKQVLPDKIPNSGTAQRAFYQKLLTNPVAAGGGLLGAGYGADQMGLNPAYAIPAAAIPFLSARALAGKPASEATKKLLEKLGAAGLLSLAP